MLLRPMNIKLNCRKKVQQYTIFLQYFSYKNGKVEFIKRVSQAFTRVREKGGRGVRKGRERECKIPAANEITFCR